MSASTLGAALSSEDMSLLVSLLQKPENLSRSRDSLSDYIARINEQHRRKSQQAGSTDLRSLQQKYKETKGYEG